MPPPRGGGARRGGKGKGAGGRSKRAPAGAAPARAAAAAAAASAAAAEPPPSPLSASRARVAVVSSAFPPAGLSGSQAQQARAQAQLASGARGVWVSWGKWRDILQQLEARHEGASALSEGAGVVELEYQREVDALRARNAGLLTAASRLEDALAAERARATREVAQLGEALAGARRAAREAAERCQAQGDALARARNERDAHAARNAALGEALEAARAALALEQGKRELADVAAKELGGEAAYLQDRHRRDTDKLEEVSRQCSGAAEVASMLQAQVDYMKAELQRKPDFDAAWQLGRLKADNQRLLTMLGATSEFKAFARDVSGESDAAGEKQLMYLPLSRVLVDEGVLESTYPELRDRALVLKREADHWVPAEVVRLTEAFVRKLELPDVPVAPFMHLLVQLNRLWRTHAHERLEHQRKIKDREIRQLKRVVNAAKPVDLVVKEHKIKQLKKEKGKAELKAERLRLAVKAAQVGATSAEEQELAETVDTLQRTAVRALAADVDAMALWKARLGEAPKMYTHVIADRRSAMQSGLSAVEAAVAVPASPGLPPPQATPQPSPAAIYVAEEVHVPFASRRRPASARAAKKKAWM